MYWKSWVKLVSCTPRHAKAVVHAGTHCVSLVHAATLTHKGARHHSETHECRRHDDHTVARYVVPPPEARGRGACITRAYRASTAPGPHPGESPLLAFPAGQAPEGLVRTLEAVFLTGNRAVDKPSPEEPAGPPSYVLDLDLDLEAGVDEDDNTMCMPACPLWRRQLSRFRFVGRSWSPLIVSWMVFSGSWYFQGVGPDRDFVLTFARSKAC